MGILSGNKRMTLLPDNKKPVGRPAGEVNPESLLRAELIAHLRLYKRVRGMVEKVLDNSDRTLDVDDIAKYMDLLRKGIVDMSKPFIATAKPQDAAREQAAEDGEHILQRPLAGEGSRR